MSHEKTPQIILAETAGFCFGVNRAVELVYQLLDSGEKVCTLGPIIHNPQLVEELSHRGVKIVDSPAQVSKDEILVIRSHGVAADVYKCAESENIRIADATCPYVSKIHRVVRDASSTGNIILIAGDENHSEVLGIKGYTSGCCYVFADEAELLKLIEKHPEISVKPVTAVVQTTFNADLWCTCQKTLKKVCTNVNVFDTICNATAMRQKEAARLAQKCDVMVVIGGKHSSNTNKLFDVCKEYCARTFLIETADELLAEVITNSDTIGVAAGASTPAGIIKEVLQTMSEILKPVEGSDEAVKETAVTEETKQEVVETEATAADDVTAAESGDEAAAQAAEHGEENAAAETVVEEAPVVQKSFDEMTFEEALEASLNSLNTDQRVKGIVLSVNPTEIQVDIGRKQTGYVSADEFSSDPSLKLEEAVKRGDELDLIVMRTNDQEGTVMLSKRRFDAIAGWDKIVAAEDSEEILEGTVTEIIKGGVIAVCENVRIFIPASQATASRGESLEDLKGKKVNFRIIEIGRGRRAIGSVRSVMRDQRKILEAKFWETAEAGKHYTGVVKSLTSYGAFVDLGGVDGMIHISELSWARIKHPSEVVNAGDTVEVYIKDVDTEKKKISLGFKKAEDSPWELLKRDYPVGTVVKVTIVSMAAYGAFASLIPGIDGLIHISQIADRHIEKPQDELSIGQQVDAQITAIDFDKKRVSLSIRALLEPAEAQTIQEVTESAEPEKATEAAETVVPEAAETPED